MRIGVFDSGIGGLTVLRELRRNCPGHSTLYLGDTARVPYGSKSPQTIRRYARACAEFLLREGIDYLVVACNTASAFALEELASLPVPVSGVIEPGADLAAARTKSGFVGVLGTAGTIRSGAYERAIRKRNASIRVESIACPLFVPLVEEGWEDTEIARQIARTYLQKWFGAADQGNAGTCPDTIVLGCTHYPLLKETIQATAGPESVLIDSAEAVALHVRKILGTAPPEKAEAHRLFLTDASEGFVRFVRRFFADFDPAAGDKIEWVDLELAS